VFAAGLHLSDAFAAGGSPAQGGRIPRAMAVPAASSGVLAVLIATP
jgi:hypothetical protein